MNYSRFLVVVFFFSSSDEEERSSLIEETEVDGTQVNGTDKPAESRIRNL